jgi:hypothetical protein
MTETASLCPLRGRCNVGDYEGLWAIPVAAAFAYTSPWGTAPMALRASSHQSARFVLRGASAVLAAHPTIICEIHTAEEKKQSSLN